MTKKENKVRKLDKYINQFDSSFPTKPDLYNQTIEDEHSSIFTEDDLIFMTNHVELNHNEVDNSHNFLRLDSCQKKCSKCGEIKEYSYFNKNKYQGDGLTSACRKCKNKVIAKSNKKRFETDDLFRFRVLMAGVTYSAFKKKGYSKTTQTHKLLGVDFLIAFNHIEKQFIKGMTWDNRGKWELDHIIPLASAKSKDELIKLCHYSNLQPMWKKDNRFKSDTMPLVSTLPHTALG